MFNQRELLQAKNINEIRAMMTQRGAGWKPTEKKASLIDRYLELTLSVQPNEVINADSTTHSNLNPKQAVSHQNTPEAIQSRLKWFLDRGLELTIEDDVWHMRRLIGERRGSDGQWYKAYREDSGTTRQPLDVIARCAEMVMQQSAATSVA